MSNDVENIKAFLRGNHKVISGVTYNKVKVKHFDISIEMTNVLNEVALLCADSVFLQNILQHTALVNMDDKELTDEEHLKRTQVLNENSVAISEKILDAVTSAFAVHKDLFIEFVLASTDLPFTKEELAEAPVDTFYKVLTNSIMHNMDFFFIQMKQDSTNIVMSVAMKLTEAAQNMGLSEDGKTEGKSTASTKSA